jgi:hypothetical protein
MEEKNDITLNKLSVGNVIAIVCEDKELIDALKLKTIQKGSYDNLYKSYLEICKSKKDDKEVIEDNEYFDLSTFMDKYSKLEMDIEQDKENILKTVFGPVLEYIKLAYVYNYFIEYDSYIVSITITGKKREV